MRTQQAARYARWSALMAVLLAVGVGAVYAYRVWQERLERRSTPAKVPASVEDQASGFSFSKVNGDKTLFTVRASRATEFRGGGGDRLDDVWITMYGQNGTRSDNMHTQACDYTEANEMIVCDGAVQIDLANAPGTNPQPTTAKPPQDGNSNSGATDPLATIHVKTSHVSFNRKTGVATTDQPVEVHFAEGDGQAVGAVYDSVQGQWSLDHDVKLTLRAMAGQPGTNKEQPVDLSAASLSFTVDNTMHLAGPVEIRRSDSDLTAGKVDIALDQEFHARRVVASGHPILRRSPHPGAQAAPASIRADQFVGSLAAGGWLESAAATGNVHAEDPSASRESTLDAGRMDVTFAWRDSHPKNLTASDRVVAESKSTGGPGSSTGRLATSSITIEFTAQGNTARIARATTPAATLDWQDSGAGTRGAPRLAAPQRLHMTSQQLEAKFNPGRTPASLTELQGSGGVQIERQISESQPETSTSRNALAHFDAGGSWNTVDQAGDVHLQQGQQNARGDRAHFDRASDDVTLAGSVEISEAASRTTAKTADLREAANEIRADGNVVTTELAALGNAGPLFNLDDGPAHILADHLLVNTSTNHAIYSGHARLWQGEALVQSDVMEIDQPTQVLTATGQVRATFLQTPWTGPRSSTTTAKPPAQQFWRANAGRLTYASRDGRGHLEDHVLAISDQGTMHADTMDLLFAPPASAPGTKPEESRQVTHATGVGNVQVEQGERRGESLRADYDAALGKFDLSGGPPKVHDASGNSTTGRELTFLFADDTITVDSEEGSRTLTLHRVEK